MTPPASWWDYGGAAPLYATRRTPELRTEGARVALVSDALGAPFMPMQRYVADVATELLPDGRYHYPVVVFTVPRQSGKTTELRAIGADRGLSRSGCGVFYTAQTGKDARERWADLVDAIKRSPLAPLSTVRQAAGSERVVWPNGSMFRCFSPVATSLHGYTPPLVMLDEAFAHDQQTGDDLMGAIGPAQVTIRHRQLWIVSTAGTAASPFLRRWVDAGRAGTPGVAHFEWACPDDVDPYDVGRMAQWHPAVGFTQRAEDIAAQADSLSPAEYRRAYANQWTRTASAHIPLEAWDRMADHDQRRPSDADRVAFAFDVMPDRSSAALVAAWRDGSGRLHGRVVKSSPGVAWLQPAVAELYRMGRRTFGHATDGPAREAADQLARDVPGLELVPVGGRDYADAWGFMLQHVAQASLSHDGSDVLAVAVSNVATRPTLDSAAPSRSASAGDVSPLIALMVACWALDHTADAGPLDYRFGG